MFLSRKYMLYSTFRNHPHLFFQTVLNEGGTALSPLALSLLETKYPEKAYMEFVHKQTQQGTLIARFQCSSRCFTTVRLHGVWMQRRNDTAVVASYLQASLVTSFNCSQKQLDWLCGVKKVIIFTRAFALPSVVFHPEENIVLPGVLSHAYTFDGDLKPLFPASLCNFTVCRSISRDRTTMLTTALRMQNALLCAMGQRLFELPEITRFYVLRGH